MKRKQSPAIQHVSIAEDNLEDEIVIFNYNQIYF